MSHGPLPNAESAVLEGSTRGAAEWPSEPSDSPVLAPGREVTRASFEARVKSCPFAVFDEFGKPADDRVQDYAAGVAAEAVRTALAERAAVPAQDDVLEALDLSPDSYRTEGGAINRAKLRATIRRPADYVPVGHWLLEAVPAQVVSDDALRAMWKAAGGCFYGPHIETGAMPESDLLPFLRALTAQPAAAPSTPEGQP